MLLIDREPISMADLEVVEPGITSVCDTEKISIAPGEDSLLRQIAGDCINRIMTAMTAMGGYPGNGDLSGDHLAIVFSAYGGNVMSRVHPGQLCLNGRMSGIWSPLRTWMVFYALERVYGAAWNRKTSDKGRDKYLEKAEYFAGLASSAWAETTASGLPIVWNPLTAPASWSDRQPGTWETANLTTTSPGATAGGTFSVQVTWTASEYRSAAVRGNAESHPSEERVIVVPPGSLLVIDRSTLHPPSGYNADQDGYSQGLYFPRLATGWNVYVNGVLQTAVPLPVSTTSYVLPGDPLTLGAHVGSGQYPNVYAVMPTGIPVFRA